MKIKLTKKSIAAQPLPATGRTILNDPDLPGLSLVLYSSGKRSWHLFYRTTDKKQRNAKLGSYPVLGVDDARKLAREWLADVSRGKDPLAARKEVANRKTVAHLVEWFVGNHLPKLKPTSRAEYQRLIDKHILPALGKHALDRVSPEIVQALHRKMSDTPRQANFAMAIVKKMFNQAITLGWRTDPLNPVRGFRKYKEHESKRYLKKEEFQRLWRILEQERGNPHSGCGILALQLLILTGRRKSEILSLKWSDLDLDRGRMLLANSKAGQPMEYQLTETVVHLLKEAQVKQREAAQERASRKSSPPKPAGDRPSPYVLPAERGAAGYFVGLQKVWGRVRKEAGLSDVRIHDLRHSYASMAIESGAEIVQVKELLGHRNIATTQRYVHLYADTVRESVAKVEAGIFDAIEADTSSA